MTVFSFVWSWIKTISCLFPETFQFSCICQCCHWFQITSEAFLLQIWPSAVLFCLMPYWSSSITLRVSDYISLFLTELSMPLSFIKLYTLNKPGYQSLLVSGTVCSSSVTESVSMYFGYSSYWLSLVWTLLDSSYLPFSIVSDTFGFLFFGNPFRKVFFLYPAGFPAVSAFIDLEHWNNISHGVTITKRDINPF